MGAGAWQLRGAEGPRGWRQRTGLEPGCRGSRLAGDTGNVTQTGACGCIGLGRARSAVPAQAPCRGENATARPPVHFPWSLVSPHVTSDSNSPLKAE